MYPCPSLHRPSIVDSDVRARLLLYTNAEEVVIQLMGGFEGQGLTRKQQKKKKNFSQHVPLIYTPFYLYIQDREREACV